MLDHLRSFVALLCCCSVACTPASKPQVFNHVSARFTNGDALAHKYFDRSYTVTDFRDQEHAYTFPKPTSGFRPPQPVYVQGRCLVGHARVFFVITNDGAVTSPHVSDASNGALESLALQRIANWHFVPATLDGKTVSTINETYVGFYCPVELKAIVGLWKFEDKASWIKIADDGSAFQCSIGSNGVVSMTQGHFEEPYSIAWDKDWGTQMVEYSAETLTIYFKSGGYQYARVHGPMAPQCMPASGHGS